MFCDLSPHWQFVPHGTAWRSIIGDVGHVPLGAWTGGSTLATRDATQERAMVDDLDRLSVNPSAAGDEEETVTFDYGSLAVAYAR
jgi:hypothetical protein